MVGSQRDPYEREDRFRGRGRGRGGRGGRGRFDDDGGFRGRRGGREDDRRGDSFWDRYDDTDRNRDEFSAGRGGLRGGGHGSFDDRGPRGRFDDRGPRGRFDDRAPRGRFEDRGARGRIDDRGLRGRFDDRGPPPFDDRGPPPFDDRQRPPFDDRPGEFERRERRDELEDRHRGSLLGDFRGRGGFRGGIGRGEADRGRGRFGGRRNSYNDNEGRRNSFNEMETNERFPKRKSEEQSIKEERTVPIKIAKVDPLKPEDKTEETPVDKDEGEKEEKKSSYVEYNEKELDQKIEAMKQPLYCELCEAKLSNPNQAKQHYEGKPHMKKVRAYKNQVALDATLAKIAAKTKGVPAFEKKPDDETEGETTGDGSKTTDEVVAEAEEDNADVTVCKNKKMSY